VLNTKKIIFKNSDFHRNNNILIVEDEYNLRNNLARFLSFRGYNVTTAENGAQAVELIKLQEFHIMLIDLRLPDINGIDILKEIKLAGLNIACLVMTANASLISVIDAFKYGANDYLEKPFSLTELGQKIKLFDMFV